MSRTITINPFDPASVSAAASELRAYAQWVQDRTNELRRRIVELIEARAQEIFDMSIADNRFSVDKDGFATDDSVTGGVKVTHQDDGEHTTYVIANGKDAVFIEFGAGVYFNGSVGSSPNPLGGPLGFTIGSYGPNGARNVWGFRGEDGEVHLSHGTPANMPMYRALTETANEIVDIAREVFNP